MSEIAKLFMEGEDQAVCLPNEYRFDGLELRISKIGDKVIVEPLTRTEAEGSRHAAKSGNMSKG